MSLKRKWYITLMQTDSAKLINFGISKNVCRVLMYALIVFILFLGVGTFYIWKKNSDLIYLSKLQKENVLLRDKLANFSTQMDSLLIKIKIMETWEDKQRTEKKLKIVNPDVRALGTGGIPFHDPTFLPFDNGLDQLYNENLLKLDFVKSKTHLTYETHFDFFSTIHSRETLYKATPSIWPVFGRISDNYGVRIHPIFRTQSYHAGVDIANTRGTLIYATADGVVSHAGRSGQSGLLVRIEHISGYQTRYAHCEQLFVKPEDSVVKGQIIAAMGTSGVSTGTHLHYEIYDVTRQRTVNPLQFVSLTEEDIVVSQYLKEDFK